MENGVGIDGDGALGFRSSPKCINVHTAVLMASCHAACDAEDALNQPPFPQNKKKRGVIIARCVVSAGQGAVRVSAASAGCPWAFPVLPPLPFVWFCSVRLLPFAVLKKSTHTSNHGCPFSGSSTMRSSFSAALFVGLVLLTGAVRAAERQIEGESEGELLQQPCSDPCDAPVCVKARHECGSCRPSSTPRMPSSTRARQRWNHRTPS